MASATESMSKILLINDRPTVTSPRDAAIRRYRLARVRVVGHRSAAGRDGAARRSG